MFDAHARPVFCQLSSLTPLIATTVPLPFCPPISHPGPSSSLSNAGRIVPGRPPATPKPITEDGDLSSSSLGSGRISHKRYVAGGAGGTGGSGSGELHGVAADASPANTSLPSAPSSATVSSSGATGGTIDSADGASGGAGPVLCSAGSLARGNAGGGGVGGSSRSFTPVLGPGSGSRRLATPQEVGRQVWTALLLFCGGFFHG